MATPTEAPFLVALNLTRRCNLRCAHCYLDAGKRCKGAPEELVTDEVETLLDGIAALDSKTMVVLTGGEPLLRPDLLVLSEYASRLGLAVVVGTNGTLLDRAAVGRLRDAGVHAVGISLDSLDPAYHDAFRGRPGAWERTLRGIEACRRGGLMFQIHFSVTDDNADELDAMIGFARAVGAVALNVFFLVCTGRGESVTNISHAVYERVLRRVLKAAHEERELVVRAKCAPHFQRLVLQLSPELPITPAHGYEASGCLAGTRYCRVTPEGEVTPCPYMQVSVGSVRTSGFPRLWQEAPLFRLLREPNLVGRCGACEYAKVCGGCRARAFAMLGDVMGEDGLCDYRPQGGVRIEPRRDTGPAVAWTPEALERLGRVPPFVRRFVRERAEAHVRALGETAVRPSHLHALARRRFGCDPSGKAGRLPWRQS